MDALNGYDFARDLFHRKPQALALLADRKDDFETLVAERRAHAPRPWSREEIAEIEAFNREAGNDVGATLAQSLADSSALAVVTGQQPTLFASPMYVLYKALTAWNFARRLADRLAAPVIPLFWVASDDHDFDELRQCWLRAPGGLENIGRLVSRGTGVPKASPAYEWALSESRDRLLGALERLLPAGHGREATLRMVTSALDQGRTFEMAFCRTLATFLGQFPMLFVPPRLMSLRRRQIPVLRHEFEALEDSNHALAAAGDRMTSAGYQPMIRRNPHTLNSFYIKDRVRARLVRSDEMIKAEDPANGTIVAQFDNLASLIDELESRPERFSPNVVTRPIVQDTALPAICYVGGPGEITYFAQVAAVFDQHRAFRSAIVFREFSLLERKDPPDQVPQQVSRLQGQVESLRKRVLRELAESEAAGSNLHPHIHVAFDKTAVAMNRTLDRLQRRIARHYGLRGPGEGPDAERLLSPLNYCGAMAPPEITDRIVREIRSRDT